MPWSAARPCCEPGCPELVRTPKVSRCPAHERAYQQRLRASRPTMAERGYDAKWKRESRRQLRLNPWCARCHAPATEVHHITPLRAGGAPLDPANLVSLCRSCHSSVTGRERAGLPPVIRG